ncbi:hypothetical protein LJC11_05855 [Bacteroidales bacterium OttesenSCG-928-I21]|nr:hypothetical protein [Bacteroidales bacterium OttesenSCG-928-I21]
MNRYVIILCILTIGAISIGCASKRYTKKAKKLEKSGQFTEAANLFYDAVVANKTNIDAFSGLKRTGQMSLSKKLSEFNKSYNLQDKDKAIEQYQEAKNYYDKLTKLDIQLNFPSFYTDYYNEVKDAFLDEKYYEGINLIDKDKFKEAEKLFKEIIALQPDYKDTKEHLLAATYEPLYRQGLNYMKDEKYRQAYFIFKDIVDKIKSYKNAYDYQDECLERGTVSIYIAAVKNNSSSYDLKSSLESKLSSYIQGLKNPFIRLLSSDSNADIILQCEVSNYKYDSGNLKSTEQRGYLKKTVKVKNNETGKYENKIEYDKITYTEYSMTRSMNISISYKLVDNRTNQIYKSDTKSAKASDSIHYAKYSGSNSSAIVPGYWEKRSSSSSKDKINNGFLAVSQLQSLFSANTKIKDYNTLLTEAVNSTSKTIANAVNNFVLAE